MKILSLFWGIEAGRVALDKLWIVPESYHSSEFDKYPASVAAHNYPDITHIGSVTDVDGYDYEWIDLLIWGPPCQDLSIAGKRAWLEGSRSSLFWEYVRILNEAKPKFFLVENVASMPKEAKETMTKALFGISPVLINSAIVSAQNRKRLFWVGKRNEDGTYSKVEIPQPEDRGIVLKDILEPIPLTDERWKPLDTKYVEAVSKRIAGWSDRQDKLLAYQGDAKRSWVGEHVYIKEEGKTDSCTVAHVPKTVIAQFRRTDLRVHADQESSPTLTANMGTGGNNVPVVIEPYCLNPQVDGKQPSLADRIYHDEAKATAVTTCFVTNVMVTEPAYLWRKLTVRECARLQTFPDTYDFSCVSNSRAYKGIGNSWTVDVISHIFSQFLWKTLP